MILKYVTSASIVSWVILFAGCGEKKVERESIPQADKVVSETTNLYTLGNKVFIIPSPVQTTQLLKKVGKYDKALLNPTDKAVNYKTRFEKAINLGLYGGDLGFIVLNDQNQDAIAYMTTLKKLADDLGAANIFNPDVLSGLEKNLGNQSELLKIITSVYKRCDEFFKENNEGDVAALLIAGGWLESLHFAASLANSTKDPEMMTRLGEQRQSLDNLINLLSPFYNKRESPQFAGFVDDLTDLQNEYKSVNVKYDFKESTIDAGKKVAIINSVSQVILSEFEMTKLIKKVENIRTKAIENKYAAAGSGAGSVDTTAAGKTETTK